MRPSVTDLKFERVDPPRPRQCGITARPHPATVWEHAVLPDNVPLMFSSCPMDPATVTVTRCQHQARVFTYRNPSNIMRDPWARTVHWTLYFPPDVSDCKHVFHYGTLPPPARLEEILDLHFAEQPKQLKPVKLEV